MIDWFVPVVVMVVIDKDALVVVVVVVAAWMDGWMGSHHQVIHSLVHHRRLYDTSLVLSYVLPD